MLKHVVTVLMLLFILPVWAKNCDSPIWQDLISCSAENYLQADQKLNQTYQMLQKTKPQLFKQIQPVQRLWLTARDSICDNYLSAEGREYPIYRNNCLEDQTQRRLRELELVLKLQNSAQSLPQSKVAKPDQLKPIGTKAWQRYLQAHCTLMQQFGDSDCRTRNQFFESYG